MDPPESAAPLAPADYLCLSGVFKSYGPLTVVRDVSLAVAKGEILTILGPSGCGKTTTLKIMAGILPLDRGSVRIDGRAVDHLSSHDRGTAMVFQNYALFPHLTVWQNVAFGLRMRRLPKAEIAKAVDDMLERVRLTDFRVRYPKELSGGQQQRVALARALIIKPKVLLLDEPFSSLDSKLRKQLRDEFLEIHRSFNITSVFVTHDLEEAFALSDKVAVMNGGVVEQFGAPTQIFSSPASRFVADFVGHRNLLEGRVAAATDGTAVLTVQDLAVQIAATTPGPATVSIPVHRLRIARGPIAATNCFAAVVSKVAYLGPFVQITVAIEGISFESHQPSAPDIEALRPGDRVYAAWNRADGIVIPSSQD
jgi:ABC-type Fe3+/spermidine/putrescine transport system ATPase subunit